MTTASMTTTSEKNTPMTTTSSTTITTTTGSMPMEERRNSGQEGSEVSSSDAKKDSQSELSSPPPAMDPPVDSPSYVTQLPAADNMKKSEAAAVLPVTIVEVGDSPADDSSSSKSYHSTTEPACTGIMTTGTEARIRRRSLCSLPGRLFSFIVSVIRVIVIIVQNLYHVLTYLFFNWVFFYPIYFFHPSLFNSIENFLYNICLYTVGSWSWSANIQVIECGDDLYRIRNTPSGVAYGSNGNNNCHLSNSQGNQNSNHQLNHHNSVNHMMNQTCKDFASNDRVSTLIEIPSSPEKTNTSHAKNDVSSKDPAFNPSRKFNRHESSEWSEKGSESKGRILLLANHQSTCDVPLMFQALASRAKYVLLWVMDFQFKYSHFGLVSCTHGDYFITPKTFVKNELTKHCLSNPDKDLIILFPEGGFRYKRLQSSQSYAQKKGWPVLQHLTWPRTGAFLDLTEGALDITHIVDLTVLYPDQEKAASILDIMWGQKAQQVYFHYRVFELSSDGVYGESWLNDRWIEKEALMKSFYQNPDEFLRTKAGNLRPIQMSFWKLLIYNVIMMIGFCIVFIVVKFLLSIIF